MNNTSDIPSHCGITLDGKIIDARDCINLYQQNDEEQDDLPINDVDEITYKFKTLSFEKKLEEHQKQQKLLDDENLCTLL